MDRELMVGNKVELASILEGDVLGEAIKPLIREIHLFDTYISGTMFLEDETIFDRIRVGEKLLLKREENKFDSNAIMVMTEAKEKLGYIPESDNLIFARLMDAGKLLCGRISRIEPKGTFRVINIEVCLIDF